MKRFFLLFLVVVTVSCSSDDSMDDAEKLYTFIPDEKFEQKLVDIGFDTDQTVNGQILYADAKKITDLTMLFDGSEFDLEGIQDFINLGSLYIYGGTSYNIDLDFNLLLTDLRLKNVTIENNLIVPQKSELRNLTIENVELKFLNLRENKNLDSLSVYSFNLERLSIHENTALRSLTLQVYSEFFTALDISENINLEVADLKLSHVPSIDISKLTNLKNLDIIDSPKLNCAKISENQDISEFEYGYHTTFTTDCANLPEKEYTTMINAYFEQILIWQNIDTEDEIDGKVLTKSLENAKRIYIGGRDISRLENLKGLETLINLEWLYFGYIDKLRLEDYDFSQNSKLKDLTVVGLRGPNSNTGASTFNLDLSQLKKLEYLRLWAGDFGNPDFSQCPDLMQLETDYVNAIDYDLTKNTKLKYVAIERPNIIDISQCSDLETLNIASATLQTINISNNSNLKELVLNAPSMSNLDLSNNLNLETISLERLPVSNVEISNKQNLADITLKNLENLAALDVKNNTSLKSYYLDNCPLIQSVDVSSNSGLERLIVSDNPQISTINVNQNSNLKSLVLINMDVTNIDLSDNTSLDYLSLRYTPIANLDISNNLLLSNLFLRDVEISNVDISQHNNLKYLTLWETNVSTLDLSNKINIEYLNLRENELTSVNLTDLGSLRQFYIQGNDLTNLDISTNLELDEVSVYDNPNLECIQVSEIQLPTLSIARDDNQTVSTKCF